MLNLCMSSRMCRNCHKEAKRIEDIEECPRCGRRHTNVEVWGFDEEYERADFEFFYCPATIEHGSAQTTRIGAEYE